MELNRALFSSFFLQSLEVVFGETFLIARVRDRASMFYLDVLDSGDFLDVAGVDMLFCLMAIVWGVWGSGLTDWHSF